MGVWVEEEGSRFLNLSEGGWAVGSQRPYHYRAATSQKVLVPGLSRARAAPVLSPYWRTWTWGRSRGETPPTRTLGQGTWFSPIPELGSVLGLSPAAPLGCGSLLQPPALRRVRGSGEETGGREEAGRGGKRQLTHAFQSLYSEQPGDRCRRRRCRCHCYHRCHLRRPAAPRCCLLRVLLSTRRFMHIATAVIIIIPRQGK